jgi:hypothetical protein
LAASYVCYAIYASEEKSIIDIIILIALPRHGNVLSSNGKNNQF